MLEDTESMDRLIGLAWRAVYVTFGACAVLVAQSVLVPGEPAAASYEPPPAVAPAVPARGPAVSAVGMPTGAGAATSAGHVAPLASPWLSTVASPVPARRVSCTVTGARTC